jgi:hypothetical protein
MLAGALHRMSGFHELAAETGFNPIPLLILGSIVSLNILFFALRSRRRSGLKRLAKKRGLDVLQRDLPADFQKMLSGLSSWDTVSNAVAGFEDNDMLVAFDIEMPRGRGTYLLTVVARRCARPVNPIVQPPKEYALRTMDNWRALMLSGGFGPSTISPQRIEQLWQALA